MADSLSGELGGNALSKYVEGIAWRGYIGTPEAMTRAHEAFPAKSNYWTEGWRDYKRPGYATDWAKWSHTFGAFCGTGHNASRETSAILLRRPRDTRFKNARDNLGVRALFERRSKRSARSVPKPNCPILITWLLRIPMEVRR
jgi:hypothetical protein